MKLKQAVVIGSGDDHEHDPEAYGIGSHAAKKGWVIITGGGGGVMEAASRGASDSGGIVVGILPGSTPDNANKYCDIVIPSGIGYARNLTNILSADVIVAIGGKAGTLSELAYAWQFGKPVILCAFTGGWAERISHNPIDDRKSGEVYTADTLEEAIRFMDKILL